MPVTTATAALPEAPLLEASNVSKSFGGLEVLRRISFNVQSGEIVALVGPNGAGKTTLFNMVSGLVRPSRGELRFGGRSLSRLAPFEIARLGVGRTFQSPRPFGELTAIENVRSARLFAGGGARSAEELLDLVGLRGGSAPAAQLPALARKRLELAMALAGAPRLLLLDEILGGLTPQEARGLLGIVERLRREHGTTVFWIDHVMWAVMESADRVIVIHHGEVLSEGAPQDVARDQKVIEAYLGVGAAASARA